MTQEGRWQQQGLCLVGWWQVFGWPVQGSLVLECWIKEFTGKYTLCLSGDVTQTWSHHFIFLWLQSIFLAIWKLWKDESSVFVGYSSYWRCLWWDWVQVCDHEFLALLELEWGQDPPDSCQSVVKPKEKNLWVCESFTWTSQLWIMGSCLCDDSQGVKDPPLIDQSARESD